MWVYNIKMHMENCWIIHRTKIVYREGRKPYQYLHVQMGHHANIEERNGREQKLCAGREKNPTITCKYKWDTMTIYKEEQNGRKEKV